MTQEILEITPQISLLKFLPAGMRLANVEHAVRPEAVAWYQTPQIQQMVNGTSAPFTAQQVAQMYAYQARHGKLWYIRYEGEIVGDFSISDAQEIAIVLAQDFQGLGIGTAILRFFVAQRRSARKQKLFHEQHFPQPRSLWAKIFAENQASKQLFYKCGFTCVQKLTEHGKEYLKFVLTDDENPT